MRARPGRVAPQPPVPSLSPPPTVVASPDLITSPPPRSGLSLDKIEKLKLLSTAESLGALSLAEGLAFTSPASYVTACVPFLTLAGACVLFAPAGSEGAADVAAGIFALIGLTFVGLGAGVAALQADD